jgi:hypothetical protein
MRSIGVGVAIALGLALSGCTSNRPTGPTPTGQISVQGGMQTASAAWMSGSTAVSWDCFSGGAGCFEPHVSPVGAAPSPVITTAPTNLQQMVTGNEVGLAWGAPPATGTPTSYVIEAGVAPGATQFSFDTGSAQTFLVVRGVPAGTYYVRVRGRDASGVGPASNEVTVVVGGGPAPCTGPPGIPTNLSATVIGSVVALNWAAPETGCEPDAYVIHVGSSAGLSNIAQVETGRFSRSFSVRGVPAGTFYVRVRARIGSTVGAATSDVTVTVTGVQPAGTTSWLGLAANGDGLTINNDPDCGLLRLDLELTLVQSGSNLSGIATITFRSEGTCTGFNGLRDSQNASGTVSGTLGSGSGSFTILAAAGTEDEVTFSGTFANGRMTGTLAVVDGATGTFAANRQ